MIVAPVLSNVVGALYRMGARRVLGVLAADML